MPQRMTFRKSGDKVYIGGHGRNWMSLRKDAMTREPKAKSLAAWKRVAGRQVDWPGLDTGPTSFFARESTYARGSRLSGRATGKKSRRLLVNIGGKMMEVKGGRRKSSGGGGGGRKRDTNKCSNLDWLHKSDVRT